MPDFFDTIWQKKRTVLMSKCPIRMRRLKFLSLPYRLCLIHSEKKSTACGKILRSCCILKGAARNFARLLRIIMRGSFL